MRNAVKEAAERFLLETYNFNDETRAKLMEKAIKEILQNCQQLLFSAFSKENALAIKYAHRLKGNLSAIGLSALAEEAKQIEANKAWSERALSDAAMSIDGWI